MMGIQAAPAQLFYGFSLDEHVPDDHLLRRIDRHPLGLIAVSDYIAEFFNDIDPKQPLR